MEMILYVLMFFLVVPILGLVLFYAGLLVMQMITEQSFSPLILVLFWNLPAPKKSLIEILDEAESEDEFFGMTAWEMSHNGGF